MNPITGTNGFARLYNPVGQGSRLTCCDGNQVLGGCAEQRPARCDQSNGGKNCHHDEDGDAYPSLLFWQTQLLMYLVSLVQQLMTMFTKEFFCTFSFTSLALAI